MKAKITYQNIGRNKFNSTQWLNVNSKDMQEVIESCEIHAFAEVQKHLMSSVVELCPNEFEDYKKTNSYGVWVGGMRKVGDVKIEVIK